MSQKLFSNNKILYTMLVISLSYSNLINHLYQKICNKFLLFDVNSYGNLLTSLSCCIGWQESSRSPPARTLMRMPSWGRAGTVFPGLMQWAAVITCVAFFTTAPHKFEPDGRIIVICTCHGNCCMEIDIAIKLGGFE